MKENQDKRAAEWRRKRAENDLKQSFQSRQD
jgi:hypothetical protein